MAIEKRNRGAWLAALLPPAIALAACSSEPIDPSPESRFLQDRLIPHMIQWGRGKSEVLPLGPILASQGFEKICTVAEYGRIAKLEAEVPGISTYRGSVGKAVPENRIAIIGIKGDSAHVAYVLTSELTLRNKRPLCSGIDNAAIRRLPNEHPEWPGHIPDALLEEAE